MKSKLFAIALLSGPLFARPSLAGEQYVFLECRQNPGTHSIRSYSGYAIADKLDFSASGIVFVGRDHVLAKRAIDETACNKWYWDSKQQWDGTDWVSVDYKVSRDWNALEVQKQGATLYLTCGPASELRVFDTKELWLDEVYKTVKGERTGQINQRSCLMDGVN
jgi:hypothetical protein